MNDLEIELQFLAWKYPLSLFNYILASEEDTTSQQDIIYSDVSKTDQHFIIDVAKAQDSVKVTGEKYIMI